MPCWPSGFPLVPTARSTGCVWESPPGARHPGRGSPSREQTHRYGPALRPADARERTKARLPAMARRSACRAHRPRRPGGRPWPWLLGAPDQVRPPGAPPCVKPTRTGRRPEGERYVVQLVLAGVPYHKPKHAVGRDTVGLDLGSGQHRHRAAGSRGPARAAVRGVASRCALHPPDAAPHGAAEASGQS